MSSSLVSSFKGDFSFCKPSRGPTSTIRTSPASLRMLVDSFRREPLGKYLVNGWTLNLVTDIMQLEHDVREVISTSILSIPARSSSSV